MKTKRNILFAVFCLALTIFLTACGSSDASGTAKAKNVDYERDLTQYLDPLVGCPYEIKSLTVDQDASEKGDVRENIVCDVVYEVGPAERVERYRLHYQLFEKDSDEHPQGGWYLAYTEPLESNLWTNTVVRGINVEELQRELVEHGNNITVYGRKVPFASDEIQNLVITAQETDLENFSDLVDFKFDLVSDIATYHIEAQARFSVAQHTWWLSTYKNVQGSLDFNEGYELTISESQTLELINQQNPVHWFNDLSLSEEEVSDFDLVFRSFDWPTKVLIADCSFTLHKPLADFAVTVVVYCEFENGAWCPKALSSLKTSLSSVDLSGTWHGRYHYYDFAEEIDLYADLEMVLAESGDGQNFTGTIYFGPDGEQPPRSYGSMSYEASAHSLFAWSPYNSVTINAAKGALGDIPYGDPLHNIAYGTSSLFGAIDFEQSTFSDSWNGVVFSFDGR